MLAVVSVKQGIIQATTRRLSLKTHFTRVMRFNERRVDDFIKMNANAKQIEDPETLCGTLLQRPIAVEVKGAI